MSMMTTHKPKVRRWQALALAALLLAGGTVALPQPADAATTKSKTCGATVTVCKIRFAVHKVGRTELRSLYFTTNADVRLSGGGVKYVVRDLTRGTVLCKGTTSYTDQRVWCRIPNRTATVSIDMTKGTRVGTPSATLY